MATLTQYYGTGRRKTSVARVFLRPGHGKATVNGRPLDDYFHVDSYKRELMAPLQVVEQAGSFDLLVNVRGGGTAGQAGAIRLGIARALVEANASWKPELRRFGMLTRDSREVERKKYGRPGARKRFQFSKR